MATRTESATTKSPKHGATVLGRSAATGRFVLAPASRPGLVTLKKAKAVVASLRAQQPVFGEFIEEPAAQRLSEPSAETLLISAES